MTYHPERLKRTETIRVRQHEGQWIVEKIVWKTSQWTTLQVCATEAIAEKFARDVQLRCDLQIGIEDSKL